MAGSPAPSSTRRPIILPSNPLPPAPSATLLAAIDAQKAAIESHIVELTNQDREANGLPPLSVDDRLAAAAEIQANAMATLNDLSHVLPGAAYPTFDDRLHGVGFVYWWAGENIAFDAPDARSVEALWMDSPTHRENILSPHPTAIGAAVAYDSQGAPYYCVEFGVPQ